jgi:hypothetical protein
LSIIGIGSIRASVSAGGDVAGLSGAALRLRADVRRGIRRAFASAGIEFIDENGGGSGMRLAQTSAGKTARY